MAQTYLTKTFSSSGNLDVWTVSFWVKKSLIETGSDQYVMHAQTDADNQTGIVLRGSGDNYQLQCFNAVSASANNGFNVYTSRYFRDASAWYHIVVACDTTESSGSNGLKIYVNGTQQSLTVGAWNQNVDTQFSKNQQHVVGAKTGNSLGFSGYLSQFIFANGTQYAASTFGSTNANGIWVPNTSPSVTYGTNGFKLDFTGTGTSADSSGFGADSSGNNNHFASNNLGTNPNTKDGPENNFCTMNPLDQSNSYAVGNATSGTFTLGNLGFSSAGQIGGSERYYRTGSTIALPEGGKWYWEAKPTAGSNGLGFRWTMALMSTSHAYAVDSIKEYTNAQGSWGSYSGDGTVRCNNSTIATYSTIAVNDIVSFKYDADNRDLFIAKNGTYFNSGNAVLTASNITDTGQKLIYLENGSDGNVATQMNFGQPPFAIASSNADANGEGSFEYAVPSGYYALCTNNLALYGG